MYIKKEYIYILGIWIIYDNVIVSISYNKMLYYLAWCGTDMIMTLSWYDLLFAATKRTEDIFCSSFPIPERSGSTCTWKFTVHDSMTFLFLCQGAKLKNLEWTDLGVRGSRLMGDESTIAQVHPKEWLDDTKTVKLCSDSAKVTGLAAICLTLFSWF